MVSEHDYSVIVKGLKSVLTGFLPSTVAVMGFVVARVPVVSPDNAVMISIAEIPIQGVQPYSLLPRLVISR